MEDRSLFFAIRGTCEIIVKNHAFKDYPERGFSAAEIISLVRYGVGPFKDNTSAVAIDGSYLFFPKDDLDRKCKLVILIEILEIENEVSREADPVIIVCSAYREL